MNRSSLTFLSLTLALLTPQLAVAQCRTDAPRVDRGGKIQWRQDIPEAFKHARQTQQPIMIYFTADW